MKEGVFIVFLSSLQLCDWLKLTCTLFFVSHTPRWSFRNNVQCVYTHLRWWISQPACFRPRNRVWSGMKHLEEEPERDGHLSNPWRSDSLRLLFPSLSLLPSDRDDFCLFFSARNVSPSNHADRARGACRSISLWLMMRIPVACHQLLFSWKTVTDADDFTSSFRLTLPLLLPDVPWRFLSFIKPLFPLPGLWRDWKGEREQRREVLIH